MIINRQEPTVSATTSANLSPRVTGDLGGFCAGLRSRRRCNSLYSSVVTRARKGFFA
jgi:hypothetical protein